MNATMIDMMRMRMISGIKGIIELEMESLRPASKTNCQPVLKYQQQPACMYRKVNPQMTGGHFALFFFSAILSKLHAGHCQMFINLHVIKLAHTDKGNASALIGRP